MHRTTKIKLTELNPNVICVLCGGYYINATTITECLHSFCRTCITRYLETSKYCPICDVMVHKTRPLEYIRSDKTLQDLVYKLVPGLYKSEMKRRREYYSQHPGAETLPPSEDRGVEFHDRIIYTEDEKISLSLELCAEGIPFKTPSAIHGHNGPDNIKINDVRYLVCPAAFSVGNLKKFIRMKFDLKPKYEIDIFQTAEPLADFYTLMDIAYIYTWTRRAPLRLYYTVYERMSQQKAPPIIMARQIGTVQNKDQRSLGQDTAIAEDNLDDIQGVKRKYNDGPDDVSFDLSTETPEKIAETKKDKDIVNPKKKSKKHVDSNVLEAVSKSEEILAKLTLDCSNDGEKLRQNGGDSMRETSTSENMNVESKPDSAKTDTLRTPDKSNTTSKSASPITLSLFEPLNGGHTDLNVYDFHLQEPSLSGEVIKPKAKRGRKKKVDVERDKDASETSELDTENQTDSKLVISDKHPKMKSVTPRKNKPKKVNDSNGAVSQKRTISKIKKTPKDTPKDKWKGKTVKEIMERSQGKTQVSDKPQKKRGRKPGSLNKVKTDTTVDSGKRKVDMAQPESVPSLTEGANDNEMKSTDISHPIVSNENHINNNLSSVFVSTENNLQESNFNETVSPNYNIGKDILTPLYGQTPKPAELNPGLPISVNGGHVRELNGANTVLNTAFVNNVNEIGAVNGQGFRPYINGYIPATESSDQPLDLTNNTHRSEYTKGKIFKTKLLKKTSSKSEGISESIDKVTQNGHDVML